MVHEVVTLYFDEPGRANTDAILRAAIGRAKTLDVSHLVVASTTGETGLKAVALARELGFAGQVVVVGQHAGFEEPGSLAMPTAVRRELEASGARVVIGTHALSSAARSFRLRWGGIDMLETIAETLRRFSQGIKVAVECCLMAADAGEIPVDRDVVAVGGTGTERGADSAVVIRPANQNRFLDLKVREIIGMPR